MGKNKGARKFAEKTIKTYNDEKRKRKANNDTHPH